MIKQTLKFLRTFSYGASNLVKKLNPSPHRLDNVLKYHQYLNLTEPFSLLPTSTDIVLKLLQEIYPSKATGVDNIAGKFLKDGATALAEPITESCNPNFLQSKFPDGWKQEKLKPLFKKGSKDYPNYYRPILCFHNSQKLLKKSSMVKYNST